VEEVNFLGHVILAQGYPTKVEVMLKLEHPKTVTEIKSLVDLASFYRRFIKDFSRMVTPLTQPTLLHGPIGVSKVLWS